MVYEMDHREGLDVRLVGQFDAVEMRRQKEAILKELHRRVLDLDAGIGA